MKIYLGFKEGKRLETIESDSLPIKSHIHTPTSSIVPPGHLIKFQLYTQLIDFGDQDCCQSLLDNLKRHANY